MRQRKIPRSLARLTVRMRRRARRLIPSRRTGRKGATIVEQGILALLIAGIVFGSYWAGDGASTPAAGRSGGAEVAALAPAAPETASSEPAAVDPAAPARAGDEAAVATPEPAAPAEEKLAESKPAEPAQEKAAAPQTAESAAAPQPATLPSFRDMRPMQPEASGVIATPAAAATAEPAAPTFRDARPLAAPSFKDSRPVAAPSFRDERPVAPDATAATAPATAAAPVEANADDKKPEPKPFEVGYFLDDRSPMVRSQAKPEEPEPASSETAAAPAAAGNSSTPPAGAELPTLVALSPGQIKVDGQACTAPAVSSEPLDGGMMRLRITSNCQPGELVQISYGGAEIIRKLNSFGSLDYVLDCFAGAGSGVEVRFADGTSRSLPVVANDLDKVSKIAVVWRSRVNLDLHVFEYAAKYGETGHLWASVPSSLVSARVQGQAGDRGHGFISASDDDKSLGDKLEVYTFYHNDQQSAGAIALALDNETRGENPSGAHCGQGALAEIGFDVSILPRRGQVTRQSGVLTRVECGATLTQDARFNQSALPGLRIRK